jgi:hypothetical protein
MIGDATKILNAVRDSANLRRAFLYALRDRRKDYYYDHFELENAVRHQDAVIAELFEELKNPTNYKPRPAYAFFPPKNELCFRRMIYIPFKDLVVRYALVVIVLDLLDSELSPRCFAHRRAQGKERGKSLLANFARESWPKFCSWQKECAKPSRFNTLLRTDISAFYDAVSHDYLVKTIAGQLAIPPDSEVMQLFRKLLEIPVISYSHLTGKPCETENMLQGLAIGNNTEGVLANLYLRSIDEAMDSIPEIQFGRYSDDMRIFAPNRDAAKRAMLILQEHLLTKGLNLNGSKTEIAEGTPKIEDLRSKAYDAGDYLREEEEQGNQEGLTVTDLPFEEFNRHFDPGHPLTNDKEAKDFCHFLDHRILPLKERLPAHVDMLKVVLTRWHGSSKHASWRLVETIISSECSAPTRKYATKALLECLSDRDTSTYAKYRLLHYLVQKWQHPGGQGEFRHLDRLDTSDQDQIKLLFPMFMNELAFELNITSIYIMKVLGAAQAELEQTVRDNAPKPLAVPIRNALLLASEPVPFIQGTDLVEVLEDEGEAEYH